MHRVIRVAAFWGVSLAVGFGSRDAPGQTLPLGFTVEQIGFGDFEFAFPVGFTFLPDGRYVLIEKNTANVRLQAVGSPTSEVIFTVPDVESFLPERGLLGVAVDPTWPARPYLYCYYTHVDSLAYLTMYTASGDLSDPSSTDVTLDQPFHLLTDVPDRSPLHQAGTLRFGPDGMLYVSVGDDAEPCQAQDLSVLAGAILRLDVSGMPGAGPGPPPKADLVPAGNPFGGPDDNARLVYAWGLRNPFRFTIDAPTGDLFIGDVGHAGYDEVDFVAYASGGGENFGWPAREGPVPGVTDSCEVGNTFVEPIYSYPHDLVTPKSVIIGPLYRPAASSDVSFPPEYERSLFVLEFWDGWIKRLVETPSGWEIAPPVEGQPSAENWGEGFGRFSDCQVGPDGALYLIKYISQPWELRGLYRIFWSVPTCAPLDPVSDDVHVRVSPNPTSGPRGAIVSCEVVEAGWYRLQILDVTGRVVRRLHDGRFSVGRNDVYWDGRGDEGHHARAGVYFYRLEDRRGRGREGKISVIR